MQMLCEFENRINGFQSSLDSYIRSYKLFLLISLQVKAVCLIDDTPKWDFRVKDISLFEKKGCSFPLQIQIND